jgi:transposase
MQETALSDILRPMRGDLIIRTIRTASGATAVQIIQYANNKRIVVKHIGSAHTDDELAALRSEAERVREQLSPQLSLFSSIESPARLMHMDHLNLQAVTHRFAHEALRKCSQQCGLGFLAPLYQDIALMRIIEPVSKLRTITLLQRYFEITYAERTVYRLLPKLIKQKEAIENAAYQTACTHFGESFALVLYDVTTLYFESHEPDDDLRARGFSKDDKSKQPQIVIGLLVTPLGFPLMHEVYKGNKFEGHTMLDVIKQFQKRHPDAKPIVVADAAMLSRENMQFLEAEGYRYIVGARLANTQRSFIDTIASRLARKDDITIRLPYPNRSYDVVCAYSSRREKKDRRQFEKQVMKALMLVARKEPGKRAKFVKKSADGKSSFILDIELKEKTEKLLGIKGYCTNISENEISNEQIIFYYHNLWRIEQAFRISKTDLKTRPIFHYAHDAIKAHVLLCFMALMMGKFLEIKTELSLQRIRDILWNVHEAHIEDTLTGKRITLQTNLAEYHDSGLADILKPH